MAFVEGWDCSGEITAFDKAKRPRESGPFVGAESNYLTPGAFGVGALGVPAGAAGGAGTPDLVL